MTREEAIKILELETRQEALSPYLDRPLGVMLDAMIEASRMGASALRAQTANLDRSRWEGCRDCKRQWGVLDDRTNRFEIRRKRFCGSCGKPLTEEAWSDLDRRIGGNDGAANS